LSLGYRHIVRINHAIGIHIIAEVCVVHRLASVALHRRDIISVDNTASVYIAEQYANGRRDGATEVTCRVSYISQGNGDALRVVTPLRFTM
jgi:hypothetical protein